MTDAAGNNVYEPRALDPVGIGPAGYKAVAAAQLEAGYKPYYPTNGGDVSILAGGSIATYQDPTGSDWQFAQGGPERTSNNLMAGTEL